MRKFLSLIAIAVFISACASNTPNSNISDADKNKIATIVAGTMSALNTQMVPTEIPATPTPPVDGFSINGQLQGTLAFIRNNNLWINVNGVESQITNDADLTHTGLPKLWYSNPQISHDGTKIAFLKMTSTDARILMVSDIDGKNIRQLANDIEWTFPATRWSNDNQKIYYSVSNGFDTTTGLGTMVVKSINPTTGEIQEYGQFGVREGCGGGSPDPADGISSLENLGPFGGYIFDLSPQNNYIIHSNTCFGGGLGMLNLSTKQDQVLDDKFHGAVISPDGSRIATASGNNVVIFNVVTGGIESTFPASEAPYALLWSTDGKEILYSTSTLANTLTIDDNVAMALFGSAPVSYRENTSTLWMISLESGQSNKIFEVEAHKLKPIFVSGQKALVVIVENANKLFDYVNQGHKDNLTEYYPTTNILEVDLANASSNPITNNTQQGSFFK